jgi:hypothetical protein
MRLHERHQHCVQALQDCVDLHDRRRKERQAIHGVDFERENIVNACN